MPTVLSRMSPPLLFSRAPAFILDKKNASFGKTVEGPAISTERGLFDAAG